MSVMSAHSEQAVAVSRGERFKAWFREKLTVENIQRFLNSIAALKYGIFFALLLLLLPFTTFSKIPILDTTVPFHNITGGVYVDLGFGGVLLATLVLTLTTWSLLYTQGLIIEGIETRYGPDINQLESDTEKRKDFIPEQMYQFFSAEAYWGQLIAYFCVVALSGTVIVIFHAEQWYWAIAAALLGLAGGYLIIILVCTPAVLLIEDQEKGLKLLPDPVSTWVWQKARMVTWLCGLFQWLRWKISQAGKIIQFVPAVLGKEKTEFRLINPKHFLAILVVGFLIIPGIIAWTTEFRFDTMPALVYAYLLILFLIWTFSALDFHLARFRVNSLFVFLAFMVILSSFTHTDHFFEVRITPTEALTPVDVVKGSRQKDNLVVIVSSGGGIKATAWTTLALKDLIATRPELIDEIRLVSTVSGGTVGAAYFLDELCHSTLDREAKDNNEVKTVLDTVYQKSTTSSLAAVMYGFAFFDFWHLVSGGLLPPGLTDRGTLLESEWQEIAGERDEVEQPRKCQQGNILSFREDIRNGYLPAFIFNATVMESGRRVMITPVNFEKSNEPFNEIRGDTLTEILLKGNDLDKTHEADLNLWTAARLSAAFPYVTPAARAKIGDKGDLKDLEFRQPWQQYHIIDGGYYDNFGVTSALDWLEPVLQARLNPQAGLEFEKVIIIQLRASPKAGRTCYKNDGGAASAFVGPLQGLLNIRNGVALSRNEIELHRFIKSWNARFAQQKAEQDRVHLRTVVIEPFLNIDPDTCTPPVLEAQDETGIKTREDPLSWHLTNTQTKDLEEVWQQEKMIISSDRPPGSKLGLQDIFE